MKNQRFLTFNTLCLRHIGAYPYNEKYPLRTRIFYWFWIVFIIFTMAFTIYFAMAEVFLTDKELVNTAINILTSGNQKLFRQKLILF